MSFWDNVKKLTQPYGEEDYDDYDDEMSDYPEEEAAEPAPRKRRSPFATAEPIRTAEPAATTAAPVSAAPATSTGFGGQVLNMATGKQEVLTPEEAADYIRQALEARNGPVILEK